MWMTGGRPGRGYSWMIANDGEATSRGSAPSSAAMARARNVLPAPRSPTRWTIASGGSERAISRPAAAVSDSLRQRNCFTGRLSRGVVQTASMHRRIVTFALILLAGSSFADEASLRRAIKHARAHWENREILKLEAGFESFPARRAHEVVSKAVLATGDTTAVIASVR